MAKEAALRAADPSCPGGLGTAQAPNGQNICGTRKISDPEPWQNQAALLTPPTLSLSSFPDEETGTRKVPQPLSLKVGEQGFEVAQQTELMLQVREHCSPKAREEETRLL